MQTSQSCKAKAGNTTTFNARQTGLCSLSITSGINPKSRPAFPSPDLSMKVMVFVWLVHLMSLLHFLLHLLCCLLVHHLGPHHDGSRKQRINPHSSRHTRIRWGIRTTRWDGIARLLPRIWGLNRMAWWVQRLSWDSCRGDWIWATRYRSAGVSRIHRGRVCRVGSSWVWWVGRKGSSRVGSWLSWKTEGEVYSSATK